MEGRISEYFPDKGYGVIVNGEGNAYVFHSSEIGIKENKQSIEIGQFVNFTPSIVDDELAASNLMMNAKKNTIFIEFPLLKIELFKIKNYDVTIKTARKLWKEKKKANLFLRIINFIANPGIPMLPKEVQKNGIYSYELLNIVTFQGKDYIFSEYEHEDFNVQEKVKELNKYLSLK